MTDVPVEESAPLREPTSRGIGTLRPYPEIGTRPRARPVRSTRTHADIASLPIRSGLWVLWRPAGASTIWSPQIW